MIRRDKYMNGNLAVIVEERNVRVLLTKNFRREKLNFPLGYLDERNVPREMLDSLERNKFFERLGSFKMSSEGTFELVKFNF